MIPTTENHPLASIFSHPEDRSNVNSPTVRTPNQSSATTHLCWQVSHLTRVNIKMQAVKAD